MVVVVVCFVGFDVGFEVGEVFVGDEVYYVVDGV